MSEEEKKSERPWQSDYNWLEKRVDRLQNQMNDQCAAQSKRTRLLVRILVDKKIIGEEIAKSIEETLVEEEKANKAIFNWFMGEIEEAAKQSKYKIQKLKGKFVVMVSTGKKFPPWKAVKSFPTKPEAQAHIKKISK